MARVAAGRSYRALLRALVYRPAGLGQTSLPAGSRLPRPYLHGYALQPGHLPLPHPVRHHVRAHREPPRLHPARGGSQPGRRQFVSVTATGQLTVKAHPRALAALRHAELLAVCTAMARH
jgi:CubicO group peptidase (beta-lactamase class C family)